MSYFSKSKISLGIFIVMVTFGAVADVASDVMASATTTEVRSKTVKAADRTLQRNVRRALARTKGLNIANLTVRARDGWVTLEGSVPEQSQSDLAAQVAGGMVGVKSLKNALIVHPLQ
ncbi:BON domain-containing protein [Paraburkholderia sp.]|uniref:BON domain-containing protein n=1 Tax=Paraburkholderia sp. TaxID=1926495 RepID=UPI0039E4DF8A